MASATRHAISLKAKRKRPNWLAFICAIIISSTFFYSVNSIAPSTFVSLSYLTSLLGIAFIIFYQPDNTLSPAKIFTLLYITSFSLAPAWLFGERTFKLSYFGHDVNPIINRTALITLVGYCFFLFGYFIANKKQNTKQTQTFRLPSPQKKMSLNLALLVSGVGTIFYAILVAKSGGVGWLLTYSGGRADLFQGVYGGLFWGAHLYFVALGLFILAKMEKSPGMCLIISIFVSALFVPFHGRDLIIAPIFCWMIGYHCLNKQISWKMVFIGSLVIITLSGLVAAFRTGGNLLFMKDPYAFAINFVDSFTLYFSGVIEVNIEQFDSAMIAVKYVEDNKVVLGPMVLLSWLEPIDRALLGNSIPSIYTGLYLDLLITPEHRGLRTALSPSIIGEFWLGLGWIGISLGMTSLGFFFAVLNRWATVWFKRPLLFSAYPFVVYMSSKLVVDGTTHLFRPFLIFCVAFGIYCLFENSVRRLHVKSSPA